MCTYGHSVNSCLNIVENIMKINVKEKINFQEKSRIFSSIPEFLKQNVFPSSLPFSLSFSFFFFSPIVLFSGKMLICSLFFPFSGSRQMVQNTEHRIKSQIWGRGGEGLVPFYLAFCPWPNYFNFLLLLLVPVASFYVGSIQKSSWRDRVNDYFRKKL